MSVSIPGMLSALAMKPLPPMIARSIAGSLVDMAAEAQSAPQVEPAPPGDGATTGGRLDQRA